MKYVTVACGIQSGSRHGQLSGAVLIHKLTFEGCLSGFQRVLILAVRYLTPYECMLCAVVNLQHLWGSLSLCSSDALLVPSEYKGSGLASILSHVSHSDGTFLCSRKKQTLFMNWELSMLLPFVSWFFYSVDRIWEKQGRGRVKVNSWKGGWAITALHMTHRAARRFQ